MNKESYLDLVERLNQYSYNYHVLNVSLISDTEYDDLYKNLVEIEKEHPEWVVENSPTKKVGEKVSGSSLKKNRHLQKMYSLDNIFSIPDMKNWLYDISMKLNATKKSFIVTPKLDGLSLNLLYEDGRLVKATTRGDGIEGEDVLKNVKYVNGVPETIPYKGIIEIRGEILISKENFKKLNEEQRKKGLEEFKNSRNAAAGSLRQLDPKITKERNLDFIAWGLGKAPNNPFKKLSSFLDYFAKINNTIQIDYCNLTIDVYEENILLKILESFLTSYQDYRANGPYDIDGIVFMVNDYSMCESLGYTIRSPRFGVAYKFQAIEYVTKILGVTWQVGRTGILTPVGEIEPVNIDGVTVSRCTLHNLEDIKKKGIGILSQVAIIRSGDVIPKILRSLDVEGDTTIMIEPPTVCPCCGYETTITTNKVVCTNENCKDRLVAKITHFAGRDCLNIHGLGEEVVKDLVYNDIVRSPIDIFSLTYKDLIGLNGYMDKKINNLLCSISLCKNIEAWKFVNSLGLPLMGKGSSQLFTKLYGLDFLTGKLKLSSKQISGFSETTLKNIDDAIEGRQGEILKLIEIIDPVVKKMVIVEKNGITGKTFVITGTLSKPRETIKEIITSHGGRVTTSVTSSTDYLVCGENPGTKKMEAEKLNVQILKEHDLLELLK